jgi:DNA-binding transcriptional regulator YdaS (Cro superfamily)
MKNWHDRLTEHFGSDYKLAKALGIAPASITKWKRKGYVPIERAIAIEKLTGGAIKREELRPDIFKIDNVAHF